ncbi:probable cardiolipin synthase (CMP-forming) [Amphibalanus amphitrite]|uniref:probable cardiolipin synthase (CMP-forming) n=1 Tax=Amphibalanus amphitrite TaxID=1232801 RepID=UPI001C8FD9B1|nr:probable cardiolipin synthase (CMP-forming) [Amphibalanus amphitrite]XP_043188314.1 probable cardiolipin synthase (CMP-forming) [Amphibalanus amphitrite]XP_043188315.1 probable cardiolipin synthase (CMP-forming) [Amphibalanus amphitrite]XP_043188316.1 probable cardiolipin synthase (CMP-forming) [Amphibalanus amphitrite]
MLTGCCARLLRRAAAVPRVPPVTAGALRLVDAGPVPPPPPPPPSLTLLLCRSGHRLAVPPGVPAAPCCGPLSSPSTCGPAAPSPGRCVRQSARLSTAVRTAACPAFQWRSLSDQSTREHSDEPAREHSDQPPRSMVEDVRRTGQQMRSTVRRMVSHENIYTVPNALCVTRIALTPAIGWLVAAEAYEPALACFIVAGVTDLLDGWIARTFPGQSSLLGSFLDPLADKLLVATLFLSLTYTGLIPLGLTVLTVARDLGLIVAAAWVRHRSVPPPVTLSRYFDPTFATAQLEPTFISKVNTFLQITLVASTLAAPVLGFVDHTALRVLWCVTAGTTVTSGMVYALLQSSTYRLLDKEDAKRPR